MIRAQLATAMLLGVPVQVALSLLGHNAPSAVSITARSLTSEQRIEVSVPASGGAIDLPDGTWELQTTSSRYWTPPAVVRTDAPSVSLRLWPAATLTGALPQHAHIESLSVSFQSSIDDASAPVPAGIGVCKASGQRWSCRVPAGQLDMAFRAPGFVPVYRWSVHTDSASDLGTLALIRGSSLSGRVVHARNVAAKQVRVTLRPASPRPDDPRLNVRQLTAEVNARGFFQFTIAPGSYEVQARGDDLLSDIVEARVLDGREAELREPLELAAPRKVTIQVTPPVDPFGHAWTATLRKTNKNGAVVADTSGMVDAAGTWTAPRVTPGPYQLTLWRAEHDPWFTQTVEIGGDTTIPVSVAFTEVTGTLSLAGKPLAGILWFGGKNSEPSIAVRTHADGSFRAILPMQERDVWRVVDVGAREPAIDRRLHDVTLPHADDGTARLNINLPGNTLTGEVVDAGGRIQSDAIIDVTTEAGKQQILSESGTFSLSGLAPGRVALTADTKLGETTAPVEIEIRDGAESADVRLTVAPRMFADGVVRSSFGPIAGAAVQALPAELQYRSMSPYLTNDDGTFHIPLPGGTTLVSVLVAAPGYAARLFRMPLAPGDVPQPVFIDGHGGRLSLIVPDAAPGTVTCLVHDGAVYPALAAVWASGGNIAVEKGKGRRGTFDSIAPGAYALCTLDYGQIATALSGAVAAGCVSGLLAPGGSLELQIPTD
jgi:hypothetical protein